MRCAAPKGARGNGFTWPWLWKARAFMTFIGYNDLSAQSK